MSVAQEIIFRSPYPDEPIPDQTFPAFVLERAAALGDRPALVDGPTGRTLTFAALAAAVRRAAFGLHRRGLGKGEVFAIYCPNLPEYAVAFLAVTTIGGVNTTINPLYTADELAFQLNDARARFLLTVPAFLDRALAGARASEVEEVFVLGAPPAAPPPGEGRAIPVTPFAALLAEDGEPPAVDIDPARDLAVLPYSSGTTGLAKGVMLSHRNLVANICQFGSLNHVRAEDRVVAVLPFYHIYGMVVIMGAGLRYGSTIVTLPRFDLEQFLSAVQDQHITVGFLVPPIILALAKHPLVDRFDLSSLRLLFSGAAPLSQELEQACSARLNARRPGGPPVQVLQGYGLTETSPVTHSNASRDLAQARPGSVGRAIPNTTCKIVDPATGESLGPNQQGEVCIRGPQVMQGYLNNLDATAAMLRDGWLHTGDLGYVDADGYLFLVDRLKELIKYKGMQVAPAEIEGLLLTHPSVADAAVIPRPDEEAGEVPKAYVVLKPGAQATAEDVMAFVAQRVAPHKRVREVEFVEQVPKSASGKILRRVLVDQERQRAAARGA